jgi:outer membrane biosynthesis protein TonB
VALAIGGSVAVHAAAGLLLWAVSAGAVPKPPAMRIYKVDIVSPPPSSAGPAMAEPPMESPAGPAAVPASTETPPAPVQPAPPAPAPPKPAPASAPKPPSPAAEPRPVPGPTRKPPAPSRPAAPTNQPASASNPSRPAASATRPTKPSVTPPTQGRTVEGGTRTNAPPASPRPGLGTTGPGRRPVPTTGANPVVSSAAGEGLNVRTDGADFVDRAYLENIIRQVRRYFRPPPGARTDRASVRFWIERDGGVSDMAVVAGSGSFAFRTAAMEAVERAGRDGAFGRLPAGFPDERLAVTFDFTPPR